MNPPETQPWQETLLDEFVAIDTEQAKHGIYGLPAELGDGTRPLHLEQIYAGKNPTTNLARRLGWETAKEATQQFQGRYRINGKGVWWMHPPGSLEVEVHAFSHASTKVRQYGGRYVLDRAHGKKDQEDPGLLEEILTGRKWTHTSGIACQIIIAHAPSERRLAALLGRTGSVEFLEKHGLRFFGRQWEDRYQRGFWSAVWLWSQELSLTE